MNNTGNDISAVGYDEIVIGTYDGLDYDKLIPRECGTLATYWEDIQVCSSKEALEIGYGDGAIVTFLIESGYHVTAIDSDQRVEKMLLENLVRRGIEPSNYTSYVGLIEDYVVEKEKYAIIVVSYVLHFLNHSLVVDVLDRLKQSLAPKGVLLLRVHHADLREAAETVGDGRFKHFFTEEELDSSFNVGYEVLYASKFRRRTPRFESDAYVGSELRHGLPFNDDVQGQKCVSLEYLVQRT